MYGHNYFCQYNDSIVISVPYTDLSCRSFPQCALHTAAFTARSPVTASRNRNSPLLIGHHHPHYSMASVNRYVCTSLVLTTTCIEIAC